MENTYFLNTIEQAANIGSILIRSWFRGQNKIYNSLNPKLFREEFSIFHTISNFEFNLIEEFRRLAPTYTSNLPNEDDRLGWLFLMQHHGTPTRLLDWSQNILVALYFAVNGNFDTDGELWAMVPTSLNSKSDINGYPTRHTSLMSYYLTEPFIKDKNELKQALDLDQSIKIYPLALLPTLHFPRMVNQLSSFTIHSDSPDSIIELLSQKEELVKYVIPSRNKRKLLNNLKSLGIYEHTLFPELDSLSRSIIKNYTTVISENLPVPPKFTGDEKV